MQKHHSIWNYFFTGSIDPRGIKSISVLLRQLVCDKALVRLWQLRKHCIVSSSVMQLQSWFLYFVKMSWHFSLVRCCNYHIIWKAVLVKYMLEDVFAWTSTALSNTLEFFFPIISNNGLVIEYLPTIICITSCRVVPLMWCGKHLSLVLPWSHRL